MQAMPTSSEELIDGTVGLRVDNDNMAPGDEAWWEEYRSRLERAAQRARAGTPPRPMSSRCSDGRHLMATMLRLPSSTLPTAALTLLPPIGHEPIRPHRRRSTGSRPCGPTGRPHVTPVIAVWRDRRSTSALVPTSRSRTTWRQLERRRHDGEERMGRARRRRRGLRRAGHRRRCTAQPGGSLGGQVRQGLALRRRRRGLPPRCRHGRRLRGPCGRRTPTTATSRAAPPATGSDLLSVGIASQRSIPTDRSAIS